MRVPATVGLLVTAALAAAGCGKDKPGDATAAPEPKTARAAPAKAADAPPAPTPNPAEPAPPNPAQPALTDMAYPLTGLKTIPDGCATPSVILATAPSSVGSAYGWSITRQAFLASPQIKVVDGPPAAPGQVHLAPYDYNGNSYALVATCHDGATCNKVAAMYKAVVRSSNPQLTCGRVNGVGTTPSGTFAWSSDPRQNLPAPGDTVGLCARIDACQISTDHSTPGDPFLECQKAPARFKTACGTRYPCADVVACLGR